MRAENAYNVPSSGVDDDDEQDDDDEEEGAEDGVLTGDIFDFPLDDHYRVAACTL